MKELQADVIQDIRALLNLLDEDIPLQSHPGAAGDGRRDVYFNVHKRFWRRRVARLNCQEGWMFGICGIAG